MKEQLKIDNTQTVNAPNAPANGVKIENKIENTLTDTKKQTKEAITKHVVVYLGSGEYTDSTGRKWHRNNECTYTDEEYSSRKDLHFMVQYGEMKHTVVTM